MREKELFRISTCKDLDSNPDCLLLKKALRNFPLGQRVPGTYQDVLRVEERHKSLTNPYFTTMLEMV